MAIALVTHEKATGLNGATTAAKNTAGANLIVIHLSYQFGAAPSISDNQSNTYSTIATVGPALNNQTKLLYCLNPTTNASHTVTVSGSGGAYCLAFAAFSGVKTSGALDQTTSATNASSSTLQPGSITPTANNSLVVTDISANVGTSFSIDGTFAITDQAAVTGGVNYGGALAYDIQTTAAATNPTWTNTASGNVAAVIASFLPGAVDANVNLSGVAATAAVGDLSATGTGTQALTGVAATSAVGSFSLVVTSTKALTGVSATAAAGTLAATASATVALVGVSATAFVGDVTPVTNFLSVPMITIMNANPIPVEGEIVDDPIPGEGDMPYQIAFESVLNLNPIPMTGTLSAVPVPAEGSVP